MYELSLYTGAGGGIWASKLLSWNTVGYVENDLYCRKVLVQRIRDGIFDPAPVWGDILEFISEGWPGTLKESVDVVTAGFPCQPFSLAGRRKGENDARNLWPETATVLGEIRPQWALLENVPGLLAHPYFGAILGDLAALGYNARWDCISASALGAPHQRDRLWIVAHTNNPGYRTADQQKSEQKRKAKTNTRCHGTLQSLVNTKGIGREVLDIHLRQGQQNKKKRHANHSCEALANTHRQQVVRITKSWKKRNTWAPEPGVDRVAHGVADWRDRITALGNGQVPIVVATAWKHLMQEFM